MRSIRTLVFPALLVLVLAPSPAYAFHYFTQFADHPFQRDLLGSESNLYTGSPRSLRMDCTACHIGSARLPQRVDLRIETFRANGSLQPYSLFTNGYVPGERYKILVHLIGEHRGKAMTSGQYPGPAGSAWKVMCPQQPYNSDGMTVEVSSDAEIYATFTGNAAGRIAGDDAGDPLGEGRCRTGASGCGGTPESDIPPSVGDHGPTTTSFRRWVLDPTSGGKLGRWTCQPTCDAIIGNNWQIPWHDTSTNPQARVWSFFWQAPASAPPDAGGRIRFYVAVIDADGYIDTLDDDVALKKLAVCPAGVPTSRCSRVLPGFDLN